MRKCILFFFALTTLALSQRTIYESESFTITDSTVIQGEYFARAFSSDKLSSNYIEAFSDGFDRYVTFKFAINGKDNERPSGKDHQVYLNPSDGKYVTPVFTFGEEDPVGSSLPQGTENPITPGERMDVTFRVDLSNVLNKLNDEGVYKCFDGSEITKENFNGLYIAGGKAPLSWDFQNLAEDAKFMMNDDDGDGIYEITLSFMNEPSRKVVDNNGYWELNQDIEALPQLKSDFPIINALYNLALEEMLLDIRDDDAFMAGKKWTGVWTRDISYSILLALAMVKPETAMNSLMAKVDSLGRIIQDTGTGGSYPISTDRMTWALAAYEVFLSTNDKVWLQNAHDIIKKSAEDDSKNVFDPKTKLAYGESSFLDWREQTYPRWMDPKDIYKSQNLGTNAVHYRTYEILGSMAELLGEESKSFYERASQLKNAINAQFYIESKGYYGQYLYGRNTMSLSPKSESLGEALCILFDITPDEQQKSLIEKTPVLTYGVPCIYPQIPNIPPYHNNGIWPFVNTYYTWAAAKTKNQEAVLFGLSTLYRAAALFLTHKENFVAESGNCIGTEINSDRQLWSVAGMLASVYRVIFGINYETDGMYFTPVIPESLKGKYQLENFVYSDCILKLSIDGYGSEIAEFRIDGILQETPFFNNSFKGVHNIEIILNNTEDSGTYNLAAFTTSPETPVVLFNEETLTWQPTENAVSYNVFENGKFLESVTKTSYPILAEEYITEYQVCAIDENGNESFLSEPLRFSRKTKIKNFKKEAVTLSKEENTTLKFEIIVPEAGEYVFDIHYGNGFGPINTDNQAAFRTLYINDDNVGTIVMPQRGINEWEDWGYSNSITINLKEGTNKAILRFEEWNENMNIHNNAAKIDHYRISPSKHLK